MITDAQLSQAVSNIKLRSEKQVDADKTIRTFVNTGVLIQLNNRNNQIFFGRRGTGKTHVLKVLANQVMHQNGNHVLYLDLRTLGSTSQFSDFTLSLSVRCLCLFRDLLSEINNSLLDYLIRQKNPAENEILTEIAKLGELISSPKKVLTQVVQTDSSATNAQSGAKIAAGVKATGGIPHLEIEAEKNSENHTDLQKKEERSMKLSEKIEFPETARQLEKVVQLLSAHFYLLLDEWSSLPIDLQPYLAEFLKRTMIPLNCVSMKVASLEYRSNFGFQSEQRGILGFELGSDLSANLDLDDYFIYDRNPQTVTDNFADIIYKHLSSELPESYLSEKVGIDAPSNLPSKLFSNKNIFTEMVRSSEGVPRDLINVFVNAYFDAKRRGRTDIDQKAVISSAQQWFEQDKQKNLDQELSEALRKIVDEVIGNRNGRSFLLSKELETNKTIQRLFDARVIHLVQRGYADKDNPGSRYNIYTLDYGTYVNLKNTSRNPQLDFEINDGESGDFVVPFDDKRSIRRIILDKEFFNSNFAKG